MSHPIKVIVPIKRVPDAYTKIRVKADGTGVETRNVKMVINPFDEIAMEEALVWKEQGQVSEVIAVSVGSDACQETLRTGLALGADRAILIQADDDLSPLNVAKCLEKIVARESAQIVMMGKQSIDADNNQTGQMLAALLNWPQATFASNTQLEADKIRVTREIDGGLETLALNLPCVVTADLRLNTPRYASLPSIMRAKSKPLDILTPSELSVEIKTHYETLKVDPPEERSGGILVESVTELVDKLKNEAKVI